MGYYRAALSAARSGDLRSAGRLIETSIALGEDAPGATRLRELLQQKIEADSTRKGLLHRILEKIFGGRHESL